MNVAILVDACISNKTPYPRKIIYEAKSLISMGYDVTIFSKYDNNIELKKIDIFEGVKINRCFKYFLGTTELVDKYLEAHIDIVNTIKEKFCIYHCVDTMTWPIGYILSKRDNAKFICETLEYFPDYIPSDWHRDNKFKYNLTRNLLMARGQYIKYADKVIAVSEEMAEQIRKDFSLKEIPTVLYNSRPKSELEEIRKLNLRSIYNIENSKKIILFQGIVEQARGVDIAIKSLRLIDDIVLIIAGIGKNDYMKELECLAIEHGVQAKVIFTGYKSSKELIEYTFAADFLVYFGKSTVRNMELTIPNKFFDYIFAEKPIIFSKLLSVERLVGKYKIGNIIDINTDIDNISEELKKYINDSEKQKNNIENIKKVKDIFTWEHQEKKIFEIYGEIE